MISRLCQLGRHFCGGRECTCTCHKPITDEHAQAFILRLAGRRLWPDEHHEQQRLADLARAELNRALAHLGLA